MTRKSRRPPRMTDRLASRTWFPAYSQAEPQLDAATGRTRASAPPANLRCRPCRLPQSDRLGDVVPVGVAERLDHHRVVLLQFRGGRIRSGDAAAHDKLLDHVDPNRASLIVMD